MIAKDLLGYGEFPPDPKWPGGAKIAVNFNLDFVVGGGVTMVSDDAGSEGPLNDIACGGKPVIRSPLVETMVEYGSRRGIWRVLDIFRDFKINISILGVARGFEQVPELARAFMQRGHEVVSHGYRWIDYSEVPEQVEREHIRRAAEIMTNLTGSRPLGWITGRPGPNTRRLLVESGGILYDRDSVADELPYWLNVNGRAHLVIPYSYEPNDNQFNENRGFSTSEQFYTYLRDAFDTLRHEGVVGSPKLLSIGLHDRIIGKPGRCRGLIRLLDYMQTFDDVWFCTGSDIAYHWHNKSPSF